MGTKKLRVKFILPALTEATSPFWRPIKYSLFPPLGLATLAGYLDPGDTAEIQDEHVEKLELTDTPDLVAIQVYITSARRAYEIADGYRRRGIFVVLGGLHVTALPEEAGAHSDSVILGPAEEAWPRFLRDFRAGRPEPTYHSRERSLAGVPPVRRDLLKRHLYLVPNSLVVSRGCVHSCDFCYKETFYAGGKSYYTYTVDRALGEIRDLPGRHLFFLDDNLLGDPGFAARLFDGMRGMNRVFQGAATVDAVLRPGLLEKAATCGLKSLFIGFETLDQKNILNHHKHHNRAGDYARAVARVHDLGIMINGSFVFGMDEDDESVFARTTDWALAHGIETATFHILTPYPGTRLHQRLRQERRITTDNWDRYDTRHAVYQPRRMPAAALEDGYRRAYRDFYAWRAIFSSAFVKTHPAEIARHLLYTAGWKKFEPVWDLIIRARRVAACVPALELVLNRFRWSATPAVRRELVPSPGSPITAATTASE